MTSLKKSLPESIFWLTDKIESLIKPGALIVEDPNVENRPGMTRLRGLPDIPSDADWAQCTEHPRFWNQSPYDEEAFWLQLDLADIPESIRNPSWPKVGVVWMFFDLSGERWKASVKFDLRPAELIPWKKGTKQEAVGCRFDLIETVPECTERILPEIAYVEDMAQDYYDWVLQTYRRDRKSKVQLGGWIWPVQGGFDERNEDIVLGFVDQDFGDAGALYLHYNQSTGFYVLVETH
jgi:hypothetical protein